MKTPTLEEVKEYFKDAEKIYFNDYTYKKLPPCGFEIETLKYDDSTDAYYCDDALDIPQSSDILMYDCKTNTYAEITKYKSTKPKRYKSREVNGMDVIDLVKHWNLNFNEGNILKYLLRDKGEDIQDLEKIIDYATREKEHKNNLINK